MTQDLVEAAQDRGLRYFLISYTDLFGTQRAKLVPAEAIGAMAKSGAGFAGFATWLDMSPADPDVFAIPDPDSLIPLPWKPDVGWLAADPWMSGKPVAQAPRNVLKQMMAKAAEQGLVMKTGVECEFFLINADGTAISDPADRQSKPCYDQSALMRRYDVIAELCDAMLALGWKPYQNDHEDANGQFEMNWDYADALVTADRQAFFKYMVKSVAEKHGLRATFMPKPFTDLTGSGCHAHVSLWQDDVNVFHDPDGELGVSEMGYHFLGGVIAHADALCALTNPTVNSYKRINAPATRSGATWSPNTVTYTGNNRTHMIRIPDEGRFEFRLADGAANPYLLPAGLLAAGLDGPCPKNRSRQTPRHQHVHRWSHRQRRQASATQPAGCAAPVREIRPAAHAAGIGIHRRLSETAPPGLEQLRVVAERVGAGHHTGLLVPPAGKAFFFEKKKQKTFK